MATRRRRHRLPDSRVLFFRGFLERPKEVGSIVPSSRFLERRVIRCAGLERARTIVELGPGTGGTTRALLRAMHPGARLLAIEINPRFAQMLGAELADPRLMVYRGCASAIDQALASHGLPRPDLVLSGVPFSTMARSEAEAILRAAWDALAPGGRFVAYQVRDRVATLGRQVFGPASVQHELLNVPPMRIYRWVKPGAASATREGRPRLA